MEAGPEAGVGVVEGPSSEEWRVAPPGEVERFVSACLQAAGETPSSAAIAARELAETDYRGHYSHGLNRLGMYVNALQRGGIIAGAEPTITKQSAATAFVNANNALGMPVGEFCMRLAMEKARTAGVGWVVATNCSHFGIAGYYASMASKEKLLGMAFTNSSCSLTPTRGKGGHLGTNPISVAAGAEAGDGMCLDMATTTVALGKVEVAAVRGSQLPPSWGCDRHGKETRDPSDILQRGGSLQPLGGVETTGGYKGYGLALMVELFCSVLGGAAMGTDVPNPQHGLTPSNLGQCYIAVDPQCFAPGFESRLQTLLDRLRDLEPAEGEDAVLVPGDLARRHKVLSDQGGGIPYHPKQLKGLDELADSLNVSRLETSVPQS